MTKTTDVDFALFKAEFLYWMNRFGLHGWQIYFIHASLEAELSVTQLGREYHVANITFCTEYDDTIIKELDIPHLAKHEAIHVLIGSLCDVAESRWVTQNEVNAIEEELVNRLMAVIAR